MSRSAAPGAAEASAARAVQARIEVVLGTPTQPTHAAPVTWGALCRVGGALAKVLGVPEADLGAEVLRGFAGVPARHAGQVPFLPLPGDDSRAAALATQLAARLAAPLPGAPFSGAQALAALLGDLGALAVVCGRTVEEAEEDLRAVREAPVATESLLQRLLERLCRTPEAR